MPRGTVGCGCVIDMTATSQEPAETVPPGRWGRIRPWLGVVARVVLAGVFIAAGGSKVGDLAASGRAVNAYQIFSYDVSTVVGAVQPFVELALALLLLCGLATRFAAILSAILLIIFIAGIASAWARGLTIDCGCFSKGGALAAGQSPRYGIEIARDVGLLALAAFLAIYPRTPFSIDRRLLGTEAQ